jgi:benzoate membrane transport protein
MKYIPKQIAAAMLAGILFKFSISIFTSLHTSIDAWLVLPTLLCFILMKKINARYAIPVVLLLGLSLSWALGLLKMPEIYDFSLVSPKFTFPAFSAASILSIGLPLALVTLTGQFVPGIAIMRSNGYNTPIKPMVGLTSFVSLLLAPFGCHGVNLAAITAAICTGKECHENHDSRYIAGIVCGLLYILIGLFGGCLVAIFAVLPKAMVATIAGLALLGALANSLSVALKDDAQREGALLSFIVTVSGVSFLGLGSPFWGLIIGLVTYILNKKLALTKKK